MSISYPTSLDNFTNPNPSDKQNNPSHSLQHSNENDAIEALEAKVGVTNSAVTTSHDYKLSGVTGSDKAASLTGTETFTNKTLTSPKINENVVVTATSTELNYVDIATLGTAEASKAVTADSSRNVTSGAGVLTWQNIVATSGMQFNSPQGFGTNYRIVKSVASNDVTVALKLLDGTTDASSTAPMSFRIGNTLRSVTGALSFTLNDGTNWFNVGAADLATKDLDFFVYVIYNTTTTPAVYLGMSRLSGIKVFGDSTNTSTSDRYLNFSGANTPAATDECEVIGRINLTLSAGAGFTWSLPATARDFSKPIYETRYFVYTPTISLNGAGTAPTYTGTTTGFAQIQRYNTVFGFTMQNAAGGTAGSGAGVVNASLPISSVAAAATAAHKGVGQYYNNAAGEIGASGLDSVSQARVIRATTAFVTGADQNNAVRQIYGTMIYQNI